MLKQKNGRREISVTVYCKFLTPTKIKQKENSSIKNIFLNPQQELIH